MGRRKKSESSSTVTFISRFLFIACLILICFATGSAAKEKASAPAPVD